MMAESRVTLVSEVGIGMGGRGHSLVERVAFTGNGGRAIAANGRQKARLTEIGLRFGLQRGCGMRSISVPLAVLTTVVATVRTSTAGTVDAEEVLDF